MVLSRLLWIVLIRRLNSQFPLVIPTLEMLTHVITLQTLEIPSLRQKPLTFLTLGFLERRSAVAFITGQSEGPSRMSKFTGNTVIQV